MNPPAPASLQAMEGYFDNIDAAAINEKQVLEEMVRALANLTKSNEILTKSNEILTKTNAALTHQVTVLQKTTGNPCNPRNGANGAGGGT